MFLVEGASWLSIPMRDVLNVQMPHCYRQSMVLMGLAVVVNASKSPRIRIIVARSGLVLTETPRRIRDL